LSTSRSTLSPTRSRPHSPPAVPSSSSPRRKRLSPPSPSANSFSKPAGLKKLSPSSRSPTPTPLGSRKQKTAISTSRLGAQPKSAGNSKPTPAASAFSLNLAATPPSSSTGIVPISTKLLCVPPTPHSALQANPASACSAHLSSAASSSLSFGRSLTSLP